MFSDELRRLLFQVIGSWQVLAVTGVLVVYIFIVNNVARIYHRRPPRKVKAPKKAKPEPPETQAPQAVAPESENPDAEENTEEK